MEQNKTLLEKYFPKNFDELLLPSRIKLILEENIAKTGYRILFHSSPGTGKTTSSRLMTKNDDVLYMSGSNDFDTARMQKILQFATGQSVTGKPKTIVIDEAEEIRTKLQKAFKIIFDQCRSVNFIFITNEVEKMDDAVRSRCTDIDYDFHDNDLEEQKQNFITFALNVCKQENISYDKDGMRKLFQINFPDFRHLLVHLQEISDTKSMVSIETVKKFTDNGKQNLALYSIIENKSLQGAELYGEITKFKGKEKECLMSLGEPFFEYLNSKKEFQKTLDSAIIISKYSHMFIGSFNKFTTFFTAIVELKTIFR